MTYDKPLAEIMRPQSFADFVGQKHLLGENKPLTVLANSKPQSIILWGPPGVGKTTIANILIHSWDCNAIKLSAIFNGIKEIKDALNHAVEHRNGIFAKPTVLFIDEIHSFNKLQQDAFLHHMEDGSIVVIGATTENPSFELNNAILSRVQVFVLHPLDNSEMNLLIDKTIQLNIFSKTIDDKARQLIIDLSDGDARRLYNLLESINKLNVVNITYQDVKEMLPYALKRFDKNGDNFYNLISALHKSVRGSDPDAALYWFYRLINGGCDPLYLGRRILRIAWEDVGLADINSQTIVLNAINTYERLGSPEGELALASSVVYLAVTAKSNSMEVAVTKSRDYVNNNPSFEVPIHLRNAPTKLMAKLGYGNEYRYAHDYPYNYVPNENYWPDKATPEQFYKPNNQGMEQKIIEKINFLRKLDKDESTTKNK